MMLIVSAFNTPVGWLEVAHDEQHVHHARFIEAGLPPHTKTAFCHLIARELDAYFHDAYHRFQLPLKPQGTSYQLHVWNALLVIPTGRTTTYGELAKTLQTSPRAVGQACKKNPLALFIPCHRVVGKTSYGGYMGKHEAKSYKLGLLQHEGITDLF